ncbi:MAG TPA: hydrogenase maturation protease [Clostridia bacterium]|nr:hydrogenase maturation protease [Clostridia bacterium]
MNENASPRVAALLSPLLPPHCRTVLLGVGAELRQDDFAGMYLAGLLKSRCSDALLVVEGSTAPESCTGPIRRFQPDAVIVFDAARMGKDPGEYALLRPEDIGGTTFSTHMLPLPITLSYLEAACGCTTAYVGIVHRAGHRHGRPGQVRGRAPGCGIGAGAGRAELILYLLDFIVCPARPAFARTGLFLYLLFCKPW